MAGSIVKETDLGEHLGTVEYYPGDKDPGSPTTLLRNLLRSAKNGTTASVPCDGCTACCRSHKTFADLTEDERKRFPEAVFEPEQQSWVLRKHVDGSCVHLIDSKCSIYDSRPQSCRMFDCRIHLLCGIFPETSDTLLEGVMRWKRLPIKTPDDRLTLLALSMVVFEDEFPLNWKEVYLRISKACGNRRRWQTYLERAREFVEFANRDPDARQRWLESL